ncbi:hypothetical protein SKAU_G00322750 [Synaphobranchus kaupii]|uniref:Uncharacterized protein n=1 Tax=Synaphobranchus kaupii TaxID=118154 RepID=A0A9Q1IJQ2_SYNKA|nr:hypothetical protein SKAU_G00322750 [Synaphobranchus kaupii]
MRFNPSGAGMCTHAAEGLLRLSASFAYRAQRRPPWRGVNWRLLRSARQRYPGLMKAQGPALSSSLPFGRGFDPFPIIPPPRQAGQSPRCPQRPGHVQGDLTQWPPSKMGSAAGLIQDLVSHEPAQSQCRANMPLKKI